MNITIPLNQALYPSGEQTLIYMLYKENPYIGTYYLSNDLIRQQSTLNHTLSVSWVDSSGIFLNSTYFPGLIEFESPYTFYREKLNQSYERAITHCVHMVSGLNITAAKFEINTCKTDFYYDENRIKCSCSHFNSLYSVTRDEFEIPLTDDMSFNFKNWASLIVFTYLTLLLIFGNVIT